jgi:hypothetical protein
LCNSSSKANLDVELIVYRHLLSSSEIQEQVVIAPQPSRSEMSKRSVVEIDSRRKGSIGISECSIEKERNNVID